MDYDGEIITKDEITQIIIEPALPLGAFDSEVSDEDSNIDSKAELSIENPATSFASANSACSSEDEIKDTEKTFNSYFSNKKLRNKLSPSKNIKLETQSDINQFKCIACEETLPSLESFKVHYQIAHKQDGLQTKKQKSAHAHTNDISKEIDSSEQTMELCKENKDLLKPNNTHKLEQNICDLCEKSFDCKRKLLNHLRITHAPLEAAQKCKDCDKQFKTNLHLNIHIKSVHDKEAHYCLMCCKQFKSRRYLLKHRLTHQNTRYHCEVCPKNYKSKSELQKHTKKYHIIEENWTSNNSTDKNISNSIEINQNTSQIPLASPKEEIYDTTHQKAVKTEPKVTEKQIYTCPSCEKTYASKQGLRDHKRNVHAPPEAAQYCFICCKQFKSIHHFNIHTKHMHDDSLHVCDVCQKEFKSRNYMMKHRRTHQDTQYSCNMCPKVFKRKDNVTKHMKNAHIGEVLPCSFEYVDEVEKSDLSTKLNSRECDVNSKSNIDVKMCIEK